MLPRHARSSEGVAGAGAAGAAARWASSSSTTTPTPSSSSSSQQASAGANANGSGGRKRDLHKASVAEELLEGAAALLLEEAPGGWVDLAAEAGGATEVRQRGESCLGGGGVSCMACIPIFHLHALPPKKTNHTHDTARAPAGGGAAAGAGALCETAGAVRPQCGGPRGGGDRHATHGGGAGGGDGVGPVRWWCWIWWGGGRDVGWMDVV